MEAVETTDVFNERMHREELSVRRHDSNPNMFLVNHTGTAGTFMVENGKCHICGVGCIHTDAVKESTRPGWSCKVPNWKVEESPYFDNVYIVKSGLELYVIVKSIHEDVDWNCACKEHYDCEHIEVLRDYLNEQAEESMLDAKLQGIMEERKGCAR